MLSTVNKFLYLLLSSIFIALSNGLLNLLMPYDLNQMNISVSFIGFIMACQSIGFMVGCVFGEKIIQYTGHSRSFAAAAAFVSSIALLCLIFNHPLLWGLFRIIFGLSFSLIFMTLESWFNAESTAENRGSVFALYQLIYYFSFSLGQFIFSTKDALEFNPFLIVTLMACISIIPMSISPTQGPVIPESVRMNIKALYQVSPIGIFGSLACGLSLGSLLYLGVILITTIGFNLVEISTIMSAIIFGGFLFQIPLGKLTDIFDRRFVLFSVLFISSIVNLSIILILFSFDYELISSYFYLACIVAIFVGGSTTSIYPISVAITFDFIEQKNMLSATGIMILTYATGQIFGPIIGSVMMQLTGVWAMILFSVLIEGCLAFYVLYRIKVRKSVPVEQQEDFHLTSRFSHVGFELDPRVEYTESVEEANEEKAERATD